MKPANRPLFTQESAERDAAWVQAALNGDREAFGRLVEAYQQKAFATAYRLLSHSEDAQEAVQDAFLRAYRSLKQLKDPRRFGPWLLRTVSNLSLNMRRSRRSGRMVSLDERPQGEGGRAASEPPSPEAGPIEQSQGREVEAILEVALAQLPEKQRLTLVLFTIEGWPQKDIANMLECSLETVKWNVFQARRRLRQLLEEQGAL